jgi:predicted RND superfamily exporter protein
MAVWRPRRTALAALLLAVAAAAGAAALSPVSPAGLLARGGAPVSRATSRLDGTFGSEPIVVSIRGPVSQDTLSGTTLPKLYALERRLSGISGVEEVFGPGTLVQETIDQLLSIVNRQLGGPSVRAQQLGEQAAAAARKAGMSDEQSEIVGAMVDARSLGSLGQTYQKLLSQYGTELSAPTLTGGTFARALFFGGSATPRAKFAWLIPSANDALILVRLRSGLSDARTRAIGARIRRDVAGTSLPGLHTLVAGTPLVQAQLDGEFASELERLAPIVLIALMIALFFALRRRRAFYLLLPPLGAVLLTAGLDEVAGLGLTPATVAALPVVLGLALDYVVQLQARYWNERARRQSSRTAALATIRRLGPTLLLAGGSMIAGFLVLNLSSVPLVARLGDTLALGVLASLVCALLFTPALLAARDHEGARPIRLPAWRRRTLPRSAIPVLGVVLVLAAAGGLAASRSAPVESDLLKLAPRGMTELRDVESLSQQIGSAGDLDIVISAPDVTQPAVLTWMNSLQSRVLALDSRLTPGPNLATILNVAAGGSIPSHAAVEQLLGLVPSYFVSGVLSPNHRLAALSFGVPLISASAQARIIARLQPLLRAAPPGVHAAPGGILALGAAGVSSLQGERPWLLLLAALVIAVVLLAVRRRVDRALVPIAPALLAAGLMAAGVWVTGVQLSPLSAGLDPLVLAVGVEFGLLLEARYYEARRGGSSPSAAARMASELVGAPVLVAALTVAIGFAVLAASRFGVLQQFGVMAALELLVCATGSILIVPRLAAWLDRRRVRRRRARQRAQFVEQARARVSAGEAASVPAPLAGAR